MKQFRVETKNQATGDWALWARFKSRYRLDLSNAVEAERGSLCNAIQEANLVHRRRPIAGSQPPLVAIIETRIVEYEFTLKRETRKIIWENGEFLQEG
jgi:hypothetical protein